MSKYKTLHEFGMDEIIIEKSTFIGYAKPIKTEEEAIEFANELKKKHKDATHNVWAYTVGKTMNIQRYSDDGEPQGTAGIPTLEVIKKEANNNCLAKFIVIDYDRVKKHPGELAKLKEAATSTQSFNLWLAFNNME